MGFEQLAALKKKLAAQARSESAPKPARPRRAPAPTPEAAKPVDPVIRTIGKLQKRFPQAFPKKPLSKVPLKVGILEDILEHAEELGLTEAELRDAIRTWCRGARYWASLVEGAPRLDLAGHAHGNVARADAQRAQYLQNKRSKSPSAAAPAAESH